MQQPHREEVMNIVKSRSELKLLYYGGEYFLWIVGDMENVCTFVPSLIKVCYNLLQIRHHPNDVFSFFLDSYRGAYSEPPRIVFTSSKQFNQ